MSRFEELKRLNKKDRNKLREILSNGNTNAIDSLARLRGKQGKDQLVALEMILKSSMPLKAMQKSRPFPKKPPFVDTLQVHRGGTLEELLTTIETDTVAFKERLIGVAESLHEIDAAYAVGDIESCRQHICDSIALDGWSHAILRRIVLIRENLPEGKEDEKIDDLVKQANPKVVVVATLIHLYSLDQSYLTIKRSILNLADRGTINRYSRAIARLAVQPFSKTKEDLTAFLSEVEKCSLIDAIILAKFNSHLFRIEDYPAIGEIAKKLGKITLFEGLVATYDADDLDSEYAFFKQSSAWLEYVPIRQYRILLDNYYDISSEDVSDLTEEVSSTLRDWIGDATLSNLVGTSPFTKHPYKTLSKLELSGTATRSALFNYWLYHSDGQIGFERDDLLTLMGRTRDLAKTVPIRAARTAAALAKDGLVRLILLLLLAKRSKNELDSFRLRKLLEDVTITDYGGSLVRLVEAYEVTHPNVAEYIYDIATEDFLAKLNRLAPHRADIPEIRASLHEWMARFAKDEHFLQRARAVRIDHQLNRVRNEIDDHRIYVDPSRFSSWIEDEMMIELNSALTSAGSSKRGFSFNCDETILSMVMRQCYNTFCTNPVFGIASYIGRRIRHGTFHGQLYSIVINQIENSDKFKRLFHSSLFAAKWHVWKDTYNRAIEEIIRDRLHVNSKAKPLGVFQPDAYSSQQLEILSAAIKAISSDYVETKAVAGIDQIIIDYCWRLAESDLSAVTKYLRDQQMRLKNLTFLDNELLPTASPADAKLADAFRRELVLSIDRKFTAMFGWFKRPSIVAPKASLALLFDAIIAEVKDNIPDFNPQKDESSNGEIELVGGVYHIVYDSLAVVVANAAKHGDRCRPVRRRFEILPGKEKRLVVEISSSIRSTEQPAEVSRIIENRKKADFQDANMYQGKSGISKLMLLACNRHDFSLEQYEVVGNEVKVRLAYALEH